MTKSKRGSNEPPVAEPNTPPPGRDGAEAAAPDEVAAYIAEIGGELASLARAAKLDMLAYLLDMAQAEASRTHGKGTKDQG